MTSRFNAAYDEAATLPLTTNLDTSSRKDVTASEQLAISKDGRDREELPEEAVIAAAMAMFEHSVVASWDIKTKARHWLEDAAQYRGLAQAALVAARPHM